MSSWQLFLVVGLVKSSPNHDWITTIGDESYVKPVWCGRDYIAKVGGRERREGEKEGGREGGRCR